MSPRSGVQAPARASHFINLFFIKSYFNIKTNLV
jgi:hypothetical protein